MLWRALRWRLLGVRFHSSSPSSSQTLRSRPGGRELLLALERAPCLSCGVTPPVAARRVDCGVSGLPLACSEACARQLKSDSGELLGQFRSLVEDLEFAASADARLLFSRARVAADGSTSQTSDAVLPVASWADYLRLYAPLAGSASATDERLLSDERAIRLASSAFSYVLTLSAFLPQLLPPTDSSDPRTGEQGIALHVIGARAEAMMPDYLWDELALFHPLYRTIDVTLVGDHVPISRKVRSARGLPMVIESVRGLYHDVELPVTRALNALVLFNPGIGHPLLQDRWRPTIRTLLESGRPLLLTSFSATDQEQDVVVLERLAAAGASGRRLNFLIEPQLNPFRSLKYQANDDGGRVALIQTNSRVMAVRLSD